VSLVAVLFAVFLFAGLRQLSPDAAGRTQLRPGTKLIVFIPIALAMCYLLISWQIKG
jgi:hypothetical protein